MRNAPASQSLGADDRVPPRPGVYRTRRGMVRRRGHGLARSAGSSTLAGGFACRLSGVRSALHGRPTNACSSFRELYVGELAPGPSRPCHAVPSGAWSDHRRTTAVRKSPLRGTHPCIDRAIRAAHARARGRSAPPPRFEKLSSPDLALQSFGSLDRGVGALVVYSRLCRRDADADNSPP